jgi:hypothetical protein
MNNNIETYDFARRCLESQFNLLTCELEKIPIDWNKLERLHNKLHKDLLRAKDLYPAKAEELNDTLTILLEANENVKKAKKLSNKISQQQRKTGCINII